jgi:mRNA interferase MazF
MVSRGEIWLARLDPTEGREIRKTRPCLVVSPSDIHDHLPLVIAVPLTTGSHRTPYRIPLRFAGKDGLVLLEQIRVLDRRRLVRRLGTAGQDTLLTVLGTLQEMFAE